MKILNYKTAVISAAVLIIFGLFYVQREKLFNSYSREAESLYGQGRTNEALSNFLFAGAMDEGKRSASAELNRAKIFYENGDVASSEKEAREVLGADGNNSEASKLLGDIKHRQGDFAEAEKYYEKAYAADPSSENLKSMIRNLVREGKAFEAGQKLKYVQGNLSEDAAYYLGLLDFNETGIFPEEIFSSIKNGKYKKEIAAIGSFYDDSYAGSGNSSDYALVKKADMFDMINETDFAFSDLEAVLKRNSGYCGAYITLGKSFLISENYEKSAGAFQKCLDLDVNNAQSLYYLGMIYEKIGNADKSNEYWKKYNDLTEGCFSGT